MIASSVALFGFCLVTSAFGQVFAQEEGAVKQLRVSFEDGTADQYVVLADSTDKYTISQSHSWVRDGTSRFNLDSYSIDGSEYIEIPRKPRGSFLLEIPADGGKSLIFRSVVQYPVTILTDSEKSLQAMSSPASPTGDNWFDVNSAITITVSNVELSTSSTIRQQIVSWSLDNSKHIVDQDGNPSFTTPSIKVAAPHQIKFISKTQYYVDLITSDGTAAGEGWYDAGSVARVSVTNNDEFLVTHSFDGWQDSSGLLLEDDQTSILVSSPKTLTAKWTSDYSRLVVIAVIPFAAAGAVIVLKKKLKRTRQPSITVPTASVQELAQEIPVSGSVVAVQHRREVAQEALASGTTDSTNYSRELSVYALKRSVESLERMHSSGLISDAKFLKVKGKLEQSLE